MKKFLSTFLLRLSEMLLAALVFAAGNISFGYAEGSSGTPSLRKQIMGTGFPVLDILLDGYEEEDIHRSEWQEARTRFEINGETLISSAKIKGRGNYTWAQEKRPYAIKLDEKQDWFGLGAAKDWVLLADFTDETHLRNFYAFTLASGFGFAFTPEARHAQVFINGVYKGLYPITEKVEIDKKRLNIDVTKGDLLIELDNNYGSGEENLIETTLGNLLVIKDPDAEEFEEKAAAAGSDINFAKAMHFVKSRIYYFESGLKRNDSLEELGKYMDLPSLVDWYIFNEIMRNDDSVFNSSIYLYSKYRDKLYMGPVWDYDLALSGIDRFDNTNPEGLQFLANPWEREGNWFLYLAERADFNELVKARWQELYSSSLFYDSMEELKKTQIVLREQVPFDVELWDNRGVFVNKGGFDEAVGYLRYFINARINWLNTVWGDSSVTAPPSPTKAPATTNEPAPTPANTKEHTFSPSPSPAAIPSAAPTAEPIATEPAASKTNGAPAPVVFIIGFAAGAAACGAVFVIYRVIRCRKK